MGKSRLKTQIYNKIRKKYGIYKKRNKKQKNNFWNRKK